MIGSSDSVHQTMSQPVPTSALPPGSKDEVTRDAAHLAAMGKLGLGGMLSGLGRSCSCSSECEFTPTPRAPVIDAAGTVVYTRMAHKVTDEALQCPETQQACAKFKVCHFRTPWLASSFHVLCKQLPKRIGGGGGGGGGRCSRLTACRH